MFEKKCEFKISDKTLKTQRSICRPSLQETVSPKFSSKHFHENIVHSTIYIVYSTIHIVFLSVVFSKYLLFLNKF